MCSGLSDDLRQVEDSRKTADRELTRLNVDIAALQETRLAASSSLRKQNYTFFWQGKEPAEPRQHGVGFTVRNSPLSSVEPPTSGTPRLLSLCLSTSSGPVNLLSIYAPTLCSASSETSLQQNTCTCLATSTPEWDPTTTPGEDASATSVSAS